MIETLYGTAVWLAACAGHARLALTMPRHWYDAVGAAGPMPPPGRWQRCFGVLLLVFASALCLWHQGPGFGSLVALLGLVLSAFAVSFIAAWRPRWLRPLAGLRRQPASGAALPAPVPRR